MIIRPLTIMAPRPTPPTPPVVDEVQIGNQIWKTTYLDIDDGQGGVKNCYVGDSLKFYTYDAATRICTANYPGWHVAVETDYTVLIGNTLDNTDTSTYNDLFGTEYGGTDKYGLNLRPMYLYLYDNDSLLNSFGNNYLTIGKYAYLDCIFTSKGLDPAGCYGLTYASSAFSMKAWGNRYWIKAGYTSATDVYTIIRLVKDT